MTELMTKCCEWVAKNMDKPDIIAVFTLIASVLAVWFAWNSKTEKASIGAGIFDSEVNIFSMIMENNEFLELLYNPKKYPTETYKKRIDCTNNC